MKHALLLSLVTTSLFAVSAVKEFSELIGLRKPQNVFKKLLTQHAVVVVKCQASCCLKCKKGAPGFTKLAKKYRNKALFIAMNVEKCDEITDSFTLKSVPTFLIFIHGKPYKKSSGSGNVAEVERYLSSALKKNFSS